MLGTPGTGTVMSRGRARSTAAICILLRLVGQQQMAAHLKGRLQQCGLGWSDATHSPNMVARFAKCKLRESY
jgi:hypothetical protein